jgi:predicted dehydrogenase
MDADKGESADIDGHTKTGTLLLHHSELDAKGEFVKKDERIDTSDEPDHDGLCELEQRYLLKAIREDIDLSAHGHDAVNSLRIVLAADESFRSGKTVYLNGN